MKWDEVRAIYPNQFVKFEVLQFNKIDDKEVVSEVAVIGPVRDEDATDELLNSKDNTLVYHTSNDKIIVRIRKSIGLRSKIK
ncbi:hypothetical protein [Paenibacillus sp. FSL K6-2441]|uniref:hypothetical protein n=1 Tax=Paenibacillus TaxID=44249 RepID=UPI0030D942D0